MVWQKAMDLVTRVYELSKSFPREEACRLTSQVTRAAASIPANIGGGRGVGRDSSREYARFLSISKGSLMEAETFLLLAIRLDYLTAERAAPALELCNEVSRMLMALHRGIRRRVGSESLGPRA